MPSPHLTILTGASRGLGFALAARLVSAGHDLLCLSRQTNPRLNDHAADAGTQMEQWSQDLVESEAAATRLEMWLGRRAEGGLQTITLINNAGLIPRIAPLTDVPARDLADAMRANLEAPMLLTAAFLRATADWRRCERKVLNISSGLGRRAMASQAAYCAAKAGMDHFTRCVALEESSKPNGAKVCSLAPGVIDTDMQVQLRGTDASLFPDIEAFIGLKANNALASPEEAAARVWTHLMRPDFGREPIADVRG